MIHTEEPAAPATSPAPAERGVTRLLRTLRQRVARGWPPGASMPAVRQTRRRLLLINVGVVSAIVAVMAVAVFAVEARAISGQVDRTLTDWAAHRAPSDHLAPNGQPAPTAPPPDGDETTPGSGDEVYEPSSPNVFSVVLDTGGKTIFDPSNVATLGLPDLAAAHPALHGQATSAFATVRHGGHEYRLYTVPVYAQGQLAGAMQVGMSLDAPEHQMRDLVLALVLVGLAMLAFTALASMYLADRALVPMRLAFERQRQFSAGASHELRTPLAIARSQADLLARRLRRAGDSQAGLAPTEAAALGEDVRELVDEVDYMTRLVRDLLTLARSETEMAALARDPVDLREVAREAAAKVRPEAEARSLTLMDATGGDRSPIIVGGDTDRLRQLALILLDNAIRYTPSGGTITVEVAARRRQRLGVGHRDEAVLVVRDTGVGIAPEHVARIFEPFFRPEHARGMAPATRDAADEEGSAGLGLALAQWIVGAHGGAIAVESTRGAGSAFTVVLPFAD